jgi:NAD(P)-dependent dehydrogenase (short-subunit alcohol dehydrogenase family)
MDRTILITGAASGIGAALARRVAAPDTALLLHTRRNREGLEQVAADAAGAGAEVQLALGDLAEPATAAALIEQASTFGRLDALVHNAGFALAKIRRSVLASIGRALPAMLSWSAEPSSERMRPSMKLAA